MPSIRAIQLAHDRQIENARKMAREIVEAQNCRTLEDANQFAQNWIETAAQYARNADYWRERAEKAERSPSATLGG